MDFRNEVNKRISIFENIDEKTYEKMGTFSNLIVDAINKGNKVLTAGNGGSAANAQHITGDIVGRYKIERKAFAGVSLTVDPSIMTAVGNDYGYENVFARQVEGVGQAGDVLVVLSSSANSKNLLKAVEKAKDLDITTIGVLGNDGGMLEAELDKCIKITYKDSDLVEEYAMSLFHIMLMDIEKKLVTK